MQRPWMRLCVCISLLSVSCANNDCDNTNGNSQRRCITTESAAYHRQSSPIGNRAQQHGRMKRDRREGTAGIVSGSTKSVPALNDYELRTRQPVIVFDSRTSNQKREADGNYALESPSLRQLRLRAAYEGRTISEDFGTNATQYLNSILPPPSSPVTSAPTNIQDVLINKQNIGSYAYSPRSSLPLPICFYNLSGYVCCNLELNNLVEETYVNLSSQSTFNRCNINRIAKYMQRNAEARFGVPFEAIVALGDFAQKANFYGDLICKLEIDGRFILVYASPLAARQQDHVGQAQGTSSVQGAHSNYVLSDVSNR